MRKIGKAQPLIAALVLWRIAFFGWNGGSREKKKGPSI
jgi:hypothetical protein